MLRYILYYLAWFLRKVNLVIGALALRCEAWYYGITEKGGLANG